MTTELSVTLWDHHQLDGPMESIVKASNAPTATVATTTLPADMDIAMIRPPRDNPYRQRIPSPTSSGLLANTAKESHVNIGLAEVITISQKDAANPVDTAIPLRVVSRLSLDSGRAGFI
jgi:hypothetical protein